MIRSQRTQRLNEHPELELAGGVKPGPALVEVVHVQDCNTDPGVLEPGVGLVGQRRLPRAGRSVDRNEPDRPKGRRRLGKNRRYRVQLRIGEGAGHRLAD